eukprot:TRINITY_DN114767_c0_g1_i1.p1 TRINITY_DN114767_c0_g1~~TRINITY_DN114767_c0_g1_i1.p1  ORF type:complete len:136 (-),score=23.86 TRINITY_DN114767_c0_g1_i1:305-712(-)
MALRGVFCILLSIATVVAGGSQTCDAADGAFCNTEDSDDIYLIQVKKATQEQKVKGVIVKDPIWPKPGSGDSICSHCYYALIVPQPEVASTPGGCIYYMGGCANQQLNRFCSSTPDVFGDAQCFPTNMTKSQRGQ